MHTDGGARGNPGPAGVGVAVYDAEGNLIKQHSQFIGTATNNVAEYGALVEGLKLIPTLVSDTKAIQLTVKLDSELVQRQLNGDYKVKDDNLKNYFAQVKLLIEQFSTVTFVHIPRAENQVADKLANAAMDRGI